MMISETSGYCEVAEVAEFIRMLCVGTFGSRQLCDSIKETSSKSHEL